MGILIHFPSSEDYRYPRVSSSPDLMSRHMPHTSFAPENGKGDSLVAYPSSPEEEQRHESITSPAKETKPSRSIASRYRNRAVLRRYMLTHSILGDKFTMGKSRTPFVGEILNFTSPADPEVTFGIKRLNNHDIMVYRDKNSAVRFISEEGGDKFIQEKDYPMGTMRVDTVELGLADWDIVDENKAPVKISRKTILQYLLPEELDALYEKVLEVNPILTGRETEKND